MTENRITRRDVAVEGSSYQVDLLRLVGKRVKAIHGYLSSGLGGPDVSFKLTDIVFDDGSRLAVEGEHDFPYVVEYRAGDQPHFDPPTLARLAAEEAHG